MKVAEASKKLIDTSPDYAGYVHGDPTFSNVLWSLKTGTFKLLDPRGDFGGLGPAGDFRYDLAKIANGPTVAAIMHDLFTVDEEHGALGVTGYRLHISPQRIEEQVALEGPLGRYAPAYQREILQANQLLSSAPLHDQRQGLALYLLGCKLAQEFGIA
jgi:hypothetical protein